MTTATISVILSGMGHPAGVKRDRAKLERRRLKAGVVTDFVGVAAAGAVSIAFPLFKFSGSSLRAETQQVHFS